MGRLKSFFKNSNRYQFKIAMIAFVSLMVGLSLNVLVSYYGIQSLSQDSFEEMKKGISSVSREYMNNYANITAEMVESKVQRFFDEQAMIGDMYQRIIDNRETFSPIVNKIDEIPFFHDDLTYNGRWYQNSKEEPSVVLVQRYLLDKYARIRPEVQSQISQSAVLDLITPSVYHYGAKKLWIYFQGGPDASFMRITPWTDIGDAMDKVYPKHTDEESWEAFNPGLVGAWEKVVKETALDELASLAIVKSPTQDGGTGEIIMTLDYPIWDKERNTFKGALCIDVELDEVVRYIENVKLATSGFAYISQSNGNVFAVNDKGTSTLGIKSVEAATFNGNEGIGFNPMERFFSDSSIEGIKQIKAPSGEAVKFHEIGIKGEDYILVQKNLKPMNSWSEEKGFYKETWTLGLVVPKKEIFSSYFAAINSINRSKNIIILEQIIVAFLTIIIIAFVIIKLTREMTKGLENLELAAIEIMNKNYDVNIDVKSNDEIGKLGITMKNMVGEIKGTFDQLSIQNEMLKSEVSERKDKEKQIKYLEDYDTLTNLPKVEWLIRKINKKISENQRIEGLAAIIIGIDNFRNINEVFGHEGGDEILLQIAAKMKIATADNGIVGRLSGDEFVMIYNSDTLEEIAEKVENIMNTIKTECKINNKEVFVTVCAGISSYPTDNDSASGLIQCAVSALAHAKEKGFGNYQFYNAEKNKEVQTKISMISSLRDAIKYNELEIYYQPIFDLKYKKCIGSEALLRWNSPAFGKVMPSVFIPLAEKNGIICNMGEWVLDNALMQLKKWHDMGYSELSISVNASPEQFQKGNFVEIIGAELAKRGVEPEYLEIEVTENVFINDVKEVTEKLRRLKAIGIKIAVDDFGTGYSSLSYIRNLPIDKLKIDRSFIMDIPYSDNGSIANVIIRLARNLGIRVNAEGVETRDQESFLEDNNCDEVQGFYYSKPMPAGEFEVRLKGMY